MDNKLLFLGSMITLLLVGMVSAGGFDQFVLWNATGSDTTDQTPSIGFMFNHTSNTTFSCGLYFDGTLKASNTSTNNATLTYLSPSSLNYEKYDVYVSCTDTNSEAAVTNTTATSILSIHQIDCTGTESTIANILIAVFMIGIIVFVAGSVMSGNVNVQVIIAAAVALLVLVIMIGILNPTIAGLCG